MYQMKTSYRLENQAQPGNPSTFGLYSGVSMKAELSADPISGVPSNFSIYLSNGDNTLSFNWGPESLSLSIMSKDYSVPAYPAPSGSSKTITLTAPYKTASVYMDIQGPVAYVRVTYNAVTYELYGNLYAGLPNYVSSWNVFMESYTVGAPCGTVVKNYSVSADDTDSSTTHINYITLTARDIARKYAILSGNAPSNLQLNLAQAASLRYGTDYVVVGNRLMWEGLGLDIPALIPGLTLRPIFAGASYGEPNILRIGKRIISLEGQGA